MSRRNAALKAAARERKIPAGVYAVRNQATGMIYLGSSVNVPAALNRHQFMLKLGSHPDPALTAAWRHFGAEGFVFETLDVLPEKDEPVSDRTEDLATLLALWTAQLGGRVAGIFA